MITTAPSLVFTALLAGTGPVYMGAEGNIRVQPPRVEASIEIDGRIIEPVWQDAARLTGFSQYAPDDGRAAANDTDVLVWYSPNAIYFAIRAHAVPGSVRATLADRDHIDNDDWVQIYLSTFNDRRQALVFGVNPLGVQMDGAVVEGGSGGGGFGGLGGGRSEPDVSPDFVFESHGRVTDEGYEVELRIPFKSLRYQSADPQDWGIHVIRRIQSTGHEDSWAPARRSAASFLEQAGSLAGLTGLHRGLVMDLSPVVTARADGARTEDGWIYDGHRPEAGGNLRWGVTPNLTVNATVNPDFSQIEADATQFQIDPRQALFYPEKRPFFLDGTEFFTTPNNLFYSRRIVEPITAVKLTGKISGTNVAALSAIDDRDQSIGGESYPVFNVVRVQRDIGGASRAGVIYTDRLDGPDTNHVAAADAHLVWRSLYSLDVQAGMSATADGKQSRDGALWQALLRRNGRRYSMRYSMTANDENFDAAAGFIGRRGVVIGNLTNQIALYGQPGALVEKWTGDVQLHATWNYDEFVRGGPALERKLHFNSNFFFRGGWHAGFSTLVERYGFDPALYANMAVLDGDVLRPIAGTTLPNLDFVATLDTPRVHGVSASIFSIWGRDENFFEWSSADIVYGTAAIEWRPTERLRVDATYNLQSFVRRSDGSSVGIRRIPRLKVEYQATRAVFLRYVGELATNYQDTLRDDSRTNLPLVVVAPDGTFEPAVGVRERLLRNDWLFSYQPTPGTVLFAGYGNAWTNAAGAHTLQRTRDGLFVKVSYVFRM